MMYKNLLNLLALVVLFPSCSGTAPHISVVCEENNVGNCIVKWEMAPLIKGNVKVYASTDPDAIPEDVPVAMADISDLKMTIITNDPAKRYYYTLLFGDKYRVKIATRNVNIPGIQNFRDLGGYPSYPTKKQVRWGMIYRSAEIDSLECYSRRELRESRHQDTHRPAGFFGDRQAISAAKRIQRCTYSPCHRRYGRYTERHTGRKNKKRYRLSHGGTDEPRI